MSELEGKTIYRLSIIVEEVTSWETENEGYNPTAHAFSMGVYDTADHAAEIGSWLEGGYVTGVLRCALADLVGVMPEFDVNGDREHSGWETIAELRSLVAAIEGDAMVYEEYPGEYPGRDEEDDDAATD